MKRSIILIVILLSTISFLSCTDNTIEVLTGIQDGKELDEGASVPFELAQNYPNPFNPSTSIHYFVSREMHLEMHVYSDDWQKVATLLDETKPKGYYVVLFGDGRSEDKPIPSGDYYYTLEGDGIVLIRRMKLIK